MTARLLPLLSLLLVQQAAARPVPLAAGVPSAASVDGLPIGAIPPQTLPARGCALFLWSAAGSRALIAMATAAPGSLRLSVGGVVTDLPQRAAHDDAGFGFGHSTTYHDGRITAVVDLTITVRDAMTEGAAVPQATLTIEQDGADGVVVPVAGVIGCSH